MKIWWESLSPKRLTLSSMEGNNGADAFDYAGKHGRAVEAGTDDVVGLGAGVGDPAAGLARMLRHRA